MWLFLWRAILYAVNLEFFVYEIYRQKKDYKRPKKTMKYIIKEMSLFSQQLLDVTQQYHRPLDSTWYIWNVKPKTQILSFSYSVH